MNLAKGITDDDVRELLAGADDDAGHHVIWADHSGEVHLTTLAEDGPLDFEERMAGKMRLRLGTLQAGNKYVGQGAADDNHWVSTLRQRLASAWADGVDYA